MEDEKLLQTEPAYTRPELEEITEIAVTPLGPIGIIIVTAADIVVVTIFALLPANVSETRQLASTAPFALDAMGETFEVSIVSASLDADDLLSLHVHATFSNHALFGPDPIPPSGLVDPGMAYFAVAAYAVDFGEAFEVGGPAFPVVESSFTGAGGSVDIFITADASLLFLTQDADISVAVLAGGDTVEDAVEVPTSTPNPTLYLKDDIAQNAPAAPVWPVVPALLGAGAVVIARRRNKNRDDDVDGDGGPGGGPTVAFVPLAWMRRRTGARVLKARIEKS